MKEDCKRPLNCEEEFNFGKSWRKHLYIIVAGHSELSAIFTKWNLTQNTMVPAGALSFLFGFTRTSDSSSSQDLNSSKTANISPNFSLSAFQKNCFEIETHHISAFKAFWAKNTFGWTPAQVPGNAVRSQLQWSGNEWCWPMMHTERGVWAVPTV